MDDSAVRTIFCGNLASEVADDILFELFVQAGPLEKVSIPKERDGRTKGYGFVTFKHECSVPYAMDLMKGIRLFGKPLNLQNRTGAKADNFHNDNRNHHNQQSMQPPEDFRSHSGAPYMDPQSFNALMGMAGLLSNNPIMQGLMQQMHSSMMQPPQYQSQHQGRNYHGGDLYNAGNNRDDRRDFYNSGDRHRSRDYDYHDRHRGGNYRDRGPDRDWGSDRGRDRDRDWGSDRDRDRDRDRNRGRDRDRPNRSRTMYNRPHDNRYRSRD